MKATPLGVDKLQTSLRTRLFGQQLHYLEAVGSTNEVAKRLAGEGAPEGTVVIADLQTAGKGRLGRSWMAPANSSLLMSLIFRPTLAPVQANRLNMLCSLAAADAIQSYTGLAVGIKWPNDLVVPQPPGHNYRKLAGLLTESSVAGDNLLFVVVGMGINVNLEPAALGPVMVPATSLSAELGRPVDREALLVAILAHIENRYRQLDSDQIHQDWKQRLVTLGQEITVTTPTGQIHGVAVGVNPDGALLLRDLAGNLQPIMIGDVTLRAAATPSHDLT